MTMNHGLTLSSARPYPTGRSVRGGGRRLPGELWTEAEDEKIRRWYPDYGELERRLPGRSRSRMPFAFSGPRPVARSTRQTPRAAYAPQAGIVQRLGEMPDRVPEKTRRRNAGERNVSKSKGLCGARSAN